MRVLLSTLVCCLRFFYGSCDVLPADQLQALHAACDHDKDGKVSIDDVEDFWNKTHLTNARATVDLALSDKDGDGKLDFDEFIGAANFQGEDDTAGFPEDDKIKFEFADEDNDGLLTEDELTVALNPELNPDLSLQLAQKLVERKDENGDSMIDWVEYTRGDERELEEQMHEGATMQDSFAILDTDGDMKISVEEMVATISGYDSMRTNLRHIFELADSDSDGYLTSRELVNARGKLSEFESRHQLSWLHGLMDAGYHLEPKHDDL
eukprot:TRINITY_DN61584_c0_g1_i1.p1 TRINITY_DN61584_c0_g1~~TRINITY_DN61584_c0_g1_i1.p1  ORF type:complete len:266 (-),score=52.65 TRINITY_DN61584_c0_g1_i1:34-831(-)